MSGHLTKPGLHLSEDGYGVDRANCANTRPEALPLRRSPLPRLARGLPSAPALFSALALLLLSACGGGGTDSEAAPQIVNLGVLPSTTTSLVPQTFTNPLSVPATPSVFIATGAFALGDTTTGLTAPAGESVTLNVAFTPPTSGNFAGTLTLRWDSGADTAFTEHRYQARAEPLIWTLLTSGADFGSLDVGQQLDRVVEFRNDSTLSTATLSTSVFPAPGFSLVGDPLPLTVAPGQSASITIRYAPAVGGEHSGSLRLGTTDRGTDLAIPLTASSSTPSAGSEDIVDFGSQSFSGNLTAQLSVDIPADAIAFTIEATGGASDTAGLGELIGPGDEIYENTSATGQYIWIPGTEVFTAQVPNTDRTGLQLVSGGGTYRFRVRRLGGASSTNVRVIIERRAGGIGGNEVLDLNVFLANAITPTAATAATDTRLQAILTRIDAILAQQGIRLGAVDYYDVTDSTYDNVTSAEFGDMLQLTSTATHERLNLFFVNQAIGGGVVGVSATLGGPKKNGTSLSGVMSVYSGFSTNTVGLIAAHEVGHFLGLYHTVEQSGSHDFIDDTAECLASGTNGACSVTGGGYLMHWQAVGGADISDGQGLVIRGHPLVDPNTSGSTSSKRSLAFVSVTDDDLLDAWRLPSGWCGTCNVSHGR